MGSIRGMPGVEMIAVVLDMGTYHQHGFLAPETRVTVADGTQIDAAAWRAQGGPAATVSIDGQHAVPVSLHGERPSVSVALPPAVVRRT